MSSVPVKGVPVRRGTVRGEPQEDLCRGRGMQGRGEALRGLAVTTGLLSGECQGMDGVQTGQSGLRAESLWPG